MHKTSDAAVAGLNVFDIRLVDEHADYKAIHTELKA